MKKRIIKYLLVFSAGVLACLAVKIILNVLAIHIFKISLINAKGDYIGLIILLLMLFLFYFLSNIYKTNKHSVYAILVILTTATICVGLESFDSYFTNDYAIINGWINLFGWNENDFGRVPIEHRMEGFILIIYPSILIACSLLFYWLLFKKNDSLSI